MSAAMEEEEAAGVGGREEEAVAGPALLLSKVAKTGADARSKKSTYAAIARSGCSCIRSAACVEKYDRRLACVARKEGGRRSTLEH